jgi:hypothetical protein
LAQPYRATGNLHFIFARTQDASFNCWAAFAIAVRDLSWTLQVLTRASRDEFDVPPESCGRFGAEIKTIYNFRTLRHTAITNVYQATKDLFLTQRFARHANPITTVAYTHPSDEELYSRISSP